MSAGVPASLLLDSLYNSLVAPADCCAYIQESAETTAAPVLDREASPERPLALRLTAGAVPFKALPYFLLDWNQPPKSRFRR